MQRSAWHAAAFSLLAVAPVLAQAPARPGAAADANIVARVNDEVLRLEDVDALIKRAGPFDAPLSGEQIRQLRLAVASELVDDLLLRHFLKKNAAAVTAAELDQHMAALAESQRKQGKTLADFFRETGQTETQLRDNWAAMIQLQRLVERQATEPELRKYYEANKALFDRTTVRVSMIVVRTGRNATPGERTAALLQLQRIRKDIQAGQMTFAAAARKYSLDPTAVNGGDLGFLLQKDPLQETAITQAAFALKPGEISEPIETDAGLHLVTATDRRPGRSSRFEDCIDEVKDCYVDEVRQSLVSRLRKQADIKLNIPQ